MIKNFFQIKKHKFYINGVEEFIPTEEVMVSALRGPSWFRQLCPFLGKNKTPLEAYNKGRLPIQRTAQNCPAILELFKINNARNDRVGLNFPIQRIHKAYFIIRNLKNKRKTKLNDNTRSQWPCRFNLVISLMGNCQDFSFTWFLPAIVSRLHGF